MSVAKRYRGWLPVFLAAALIQGVFVSYRLPVQRSGSALLPIDHPLDSPQAWSERVHAHFANSLFERAGQPIPPSPK